jgi:hypothetical protein
MSLFVGHFLLRCCAKLVSYVNPWQVSNEGDRIPRATIWSLESHSNVIFVLNRFNYGSANKGNRTKDKDD